MAELTQAILKARRKIDVDTLDNLHEEFADVQIVMAQLETILIKSRIAEHKRAKLARLEKLISSPVIRQ